MKLLSQSMLIVLLGIWHVDSARADFILSSAILEFSADAPSQQDVEIISRSSHQDYIVTEMYEVQNPDTADEKRILVEDPVEAGLLVTPDKTILAGGGRRILRFVLLKEPDEKERIYRVAVKPVIKGLTTEHPLGLKILVGYEILVIVRPAAIAPQLVMGRDGHALRVMNTGNTNMLLQAGAQCASPQQTQTCQKLPLVRIYSGTQTVLNLPMDASLTYSVWDGETIKEYKVP